MYDSNTIWGLYYAIYNLENPASLTLSFILQTLKTDIYSEELKMLICSFLGTLACFGSIPVLQGVTFLISFSVTVLNAIKSGYSNFQERAYFCAKKMKRSRYRATGTHDQKMIFQFISRKGKGRNTF